MNPLTPEQQALAADPESVSLARGIARRMARRCPHEYESIEAAALFGLVLAAAAFDPAVGIKFTTFAAHRVRGAVLDAARELMPKGYRRAGRDGVAVLSLNAPVASSERGPVEGGDLLPSGEGPVGWELESADTVAVLSRRLPQKFGAALRAYYLRAGMSMARVAEEQGTTVSRVSQMVTAGAPAMLRENLAARVV